MRKMKRCLLPLCLLAGCAQQPVAPPPSPLIQAWSLADGHTAPDWAGLLDPQLAALQAQALAANRDIAQAALRWRQAQLQADQVALRWTPSLGLSTSASRPLQSQGSGRTVEVGGVSVPVSTAVGTSRSYGASASVGYELDLWDRLASLNAAQAANTAAARSDIEAARLLIRSRVAESYWTLAAIAEQLPLAEQQLALTRETLPLVRQRVAEGKLVPLEADKAAGNVQAAESRLADLKADGRKERHNLALALAVDLPGPALDGARLPARAPPAWQLGPPEAVLARRPDVQRARLVVDATLARLRASEADRYPRLSFSGTLSTGGTRVNDWLSQPLASLAANLVVPLIDWRRLDLQRDASRSELELAALALRDTLAKALVEIEAQRIDAERIAQQLDANAARLGESVESERLAALRHQVGVLARADWLQAQSARLDAEQTRLQLRLRQWLIQAALFKALGGG